MEAFKRLKPRVRVFVEVEAFRDGNLAEGQGEVGCAKQVVRWWERLELVCC